MFLLSRERPWLFDAATKFDFEPFGYGPFHAVFIEIETLAGEGLASIGSNADLSFKIYSATPQGCEEGLRLLEGSPREQRA